MTCRVLLVEDHAESAEGLAELMRLWGYECHVAPNGERALAIASDLKPDVVITDIGLPDIDGHEVAQRLRRSPEHAATLLIALTGHEDVSEAEFANSGFDHHLLKPVDVATLKRLLEERGRRA